MLQKIINFFKKLFWGKKGVKTENEVNLKEFKDYIIKPFDIELFKEINEYRRLNNLPFIDKAPQEITNILGEHALWMDYNIKSKEDFEKLGHWFSYGRFQQIILRTSTKTRCGENLAYDYKNPKSVVYAWDKSPGHKETLIGDFTNVAIASQNDCVIAIFYK